MNNSTKRNMREGGGSLARLRAAQRIALATLLFTCAPWGLLGQAVNGSVVGTITDTSRAVVPGARVTLIEVNTNVRRSAATNASGYYSFPDVPPGTYKIAVEKPGFASASRSGVTLFVNSVARADLTLQLGALTQSISVKSAVPLLQTDTSQTGGVLAPHQIQHLPLGGNRNVQSILNLIPGNTTPVQNHSRFFNAQNSLTVASNGLSSLTTNTQIEGVNDNERTGVLQVYIPPADAIQEVDVANSDYDAEQGAALGSVVNIILKSGTNQFHGDGYEYYRGQALDARNFFDVGPEGAQFVKPPVIYNYFGGSIGGPIRKNKTFCFFDFLQIADHEGQFDRLSVPTGALRNGDFSDPALTEIFDPATGKLDGAGRAQFAGNVIPQKRIDPITTKLLALVPLPNTNLNAPGAEKFQNNYLETTRFTQDTSDFDIKIDEYQGERNHISGRLSYMNPATYQAPAFGLAGGDAAGAFEGTGTDKTYSAGINWDHTFSPTLITQTRIGLNRYRNTAYPSDYGQNTSTQLGIPGVNVSPFTSGITSIQSVGFSSPLVGYSQSMPWIRSETDFDIVNNWDKLIGNHTLKWGVNAVRIRDDLFTTNVYGTRGAWDFGPGPTSLNGGPKSGFANEFASFLLDVPSTVGRDLTVAFPAYRATQLFAYGNDKWQVTPKLTLNLGLRWEYYPPATPHFAGGFSNYDPANNTLVVAGIGGNPRNLGMDYRYHDFAPRFGLAYRLSTENVIRGGFGMSYEPFEDSNYAYNFPVAQVNAFTNQGNSFGPAILSDGTPATFEKGFPAPLAATVPSNGIIPANTAFLTSQSFKVVNTHYLDPYVETWNLAYERALPGQFVLDVSYVGNHGVHIPAEYNINAGFITGGGKLGQPLYNLFGRTASVTLFFAGEPSSYNSLQVKLDHRFSSGFSITTAYAYARALGYTGEGGDNARGIQYYVDQKRNWARTDFDQTHMFAQSYTYTLPFGKGHRILNAGWGNRLLGGWLISGILTFDTGTPLDFGCNCAFNTPGNYQSPNVSGPIRKLYGINTQPWFDTSVFSNPGPSAFGNVGPYILSGPNFFNLDASLQRTIRVTERFNLEFRSDWFHATNTPQFNNPNVTFGDASFGRVAAATGGRNIDFAMRLTF